MSFSLNEKLCLHWIFERQVADILQRETLKFERDDPITFLWHETSNRKNVLDTHFYLKGALTGGY